MNNTFDFNRFGLLIKRQWQEFGKIYLISLVVVTGIIVLFYIFNIPEPEENDHGYSRGMQFRIPLFLCLGFLFISIISASYFAAMGQKSRATVELMVPGSILEKYLCGVFYTTVVSIVSFLIVFMVIDLVFINYLRSVFEPLVHTKTEGYHRDFYLLISEYDHLATKVFYVFTFTVTSVFLLGSIYFNRFHYIKTSIVLIVFGFSVWYGLFRLHNWLINGKFFIESGARIYGGEDIVLVSNLAAGLLALIFWYIGYVRLKEKEV